MSSPDEEILLPGGLMGYTSVVSAAPGDTVDLFVSTTSARWTAELVRLYALEIPSAGVERREQRVESVPAFTGPGLDQPSAAGSYVRVEPDDSVDHGAGLTLALVLQPTLPGGDPQTVIAQRSDDGSAGWSFGITAEGRAVLRVATEAGQTELVADQPYTSGCWYSARVVIGAIAGDSVGFSIEPTGTFESNRVVTGIPAIAPMSGTLPAEPVWAPEHPLLWGAGWLAGGRFPQESFEGRIENPVLVAAALPASAGLAELRAHPELLGDWDLAHGITRHGFARPSHVHDAGPAGRHGVAVNHPTRAVISSGWRGDTFDYRYVPDEYAAMHFHRTDMTDCGWESQASLTVPDGLPSGVYAFRLSDDDGHEDRVPLIVRPPVGTATKPALLVLPTNAYLAYANDHVGVDSPRTQVWDQAVAVLDPWWLYRDSHRELGLSMYESHADGHGVCYSSWRRPILTMRATVYNHDGPVWQFSSDLQLIDWLDGTGREVDVVTDADLHREGVDLLKRYSTVMTGTHPEYPSREILEAYEAYVSDGGRLMYLGGNGMYWVTGFDPEDEQVIEIRRWGGTQAWLAPAGEYHLSFTGTQGGIWRFAGRPPQKSFGVGFVAAGKSTGSAGYRALVDADSPAGWVLKGVRSRDFGAYGSSGGAAGLEVDAVNPLHGTPDQTVVLATSVGHTDDMLEARENFNMTSRVLGGARNPKVHSDLVLVPRENGGGVFSVGSIAFAGALFVDDYTNDVSVLLGTVFDRFVTGEPVLDEPAGSRSADAG
ncbi:N,N-dimethylformamidase beta subunit family domain-containing protein [Herbiconiux sp. 11R-BC]|uniref:N,N-dimethylformamidase beta subunit family domain-containing protein n=1 Tax=Herbiconiux sp. 11R-BC TaxID=3111637 RepID=UPI003C0B0C16